MKCLLLGTLLLVFPWAGTAAAQEDSSWEAPEESYQSSVSDFLGNGPAVDRWRASAELLLWWTKDSPCPVPLATTAPASTPSFWPGALGNPDTTVVLGGSDIAHPPQLGGRFTLGRWLDDDARSGVEANFLFLGSSSVSKTVTGDGSQFLTNPFLLDFPGVQFPAASFIVIGGYPNFGSATLSSSRQVYGAELNGLWSVQEGNGQAWHLLGGYRFFNVNEEISLATTERDDTVFPGQFLNTIDKFQTRNYFNGGQLGIRGQWTRGIWFFGSTFKLALGSTHEVVSIGGSTTTNTGPGFFSTIPVTTVPGGIYAQPTNIGHSSRDRFAVLPEVTLRLGAQVTTRIRTFVGYNFLYLSSVARPGNQIDGTINPTQLTSFFGVPTPPLFGDARPASRFQSSDFWAQGLTFGAEISW